jgi:hypothetical protein
MKHDSRIKNCEDNTCAMLWIIYNRTKPLKWMRHCPYIRNELGETCQILRKNKNNMPKWMKIDNEDVYLN